MKVDYNGNKFWECEKKYLHIEVCFFCQITTELNQAMDESKILREQLKTEELTKQEATGDIFLSSHYSCG